MFNRMMTLIGLLTASLLATTSYAEAPVPTIQTPEGEVCGTGESEEVMRRDHMEFILHQRDKTMYEGIRTKQYSLKECINCHVVYDEETNEPVNFKDERHFCSNCHEYASVNIDCFQCHSSLPEDAKGH